MSIQVIGAGLAGCEAAWKIAQAGYPVELYEMKPIRFSPAHRSENFAELVCSNSLKAERLESAAGLLKEEMRRLGSLTLLCADSCRVPAGGALAVDRTAFSEAVTKKIISHPLIHIHREEVTNIPSDGITVIATGPLTSDAFAEKIFRLCGGSLSFFDAAAPIVTTESLNMDRIFAASRYGRGEENAYLNCPMNKEEYETFYSELIAAQRAPVHEFDAADPKVYEGCMPIEIMARRGPDTLRFGPMKPVGLRDPKTGHRPWAVLQLRRENAEGTMYNLVGFQTNLKFPEQKRVFGLIPGLEHAEYMRYGVMHRNTFLNSPKVLTSGFAFREDPNLFFSGQITGVEGYMESAASGIMAGVNAVRRMRGIEPLTLPATTMIGALSRYVESGGAGDFQPMGANFGIIPPLAERIRDKRERYASACCART
jgi:methylenetetrahydrofolate--tRNA-(uracil-5-)-methyltransferase